MNSIPFIHKHCDVLHVSRDSLKLHLRVSRHLVRLFNSLANNFREMAPTSLSTRRRGGMRRTTGFDAINLAATKNGARREQEERKRKRGREWERGRKRKRKTSVTKIRERVNLFESSPVWHFLCIINEVGILQRAISGDQRWLNPCVCSILRYQSKNLTVEGSWNQWRT